MTREPIDQELEYWRQSGTYARTCGVPLEIRTLLTPVSFAEHSDPTQWDRFMAAFEEGWRREDDRRQPDGTKTT